MILSIFSVLIGVALLVWGADRFVTGAAATAKNLGIPSLIIGVILVGWATSLPEMIVSAMASWQGNTGLAIGSAVGSNILNIGLVLGVTALVRPLIVHSKLLKRELPILLIVIVITFFLLLNRHFGRMDGIVLVFGFGLVLIWLLYSSKQAKVQHDVLAHEFETKIPSGLSTQKATFLWVVGLIALLISSRLLIYGAVNIAKAFGISDLVIGLTVVALGTSLPELAASVAGVLKNEHDIAIGNVIGSNIFNLLGVLAMPALIHPSTIPALLLERDYPVMLGFTLLLVFMANGFRKRGRIARLEGMGLLVGYVAYTILLYFTD